MNSLSQAIGLILGGFVILLLVPGIDAATLPALQALQTI